MATLHAGGTSLSSAVVCKAGVPGNLQPKTFGHFYACKEKVTLLTQRT